jgi:hypothetical protein
MEKLVDLAKILRSKNSGPFLITLDILFDREENYRRVLGSGLMTPETICRIYKLEAKDLCGIFFFEPALGIKISYKRNISSGTAGDRDVYGAQQHAPLMELLIP